MKRNSIALTLLLGLGLGLTTLADLEGRPYAAAANSHPRPQAGPTLSISDASVVEGNLGSTVMTFTVTLVSAGAHPTVGFRWETADGPPPNGATALFDYSFDSDFFTFQAGTGNATREIPIVIHGDTTVEPNETFFVNIVAVDGATVTDGQGVGTILDDDGLPPLPAVSINDVSVTEGNTGTTNAVFTVSISAASGSAVTVDYATESGTAQSAGIDFGSASGTLTFAAGDTSPKTIVVSVIADTVNEPDENFFVNLSRPVGAVIADGQGICTIINDDCSFSILPMSQTFGSSGGADSVSVTTQAGCGWTAVSNAGFITITSGANGSGNGTVNYSVAPNAAQSRTGTISVAGLTFTVVQTKEGCVFSLSPISQTFNATGGDGSVTVGASDGCPWSASSDVPWISVNSVAFRIDGGTVRYNVANSTATDRTGTIRIAGQIFTVRQFATGRCRTRIDPLRRNFGATGGGGEIRVLQDDPSAPIGNSCNCVRVRTNVAWIAIGRRPFGCDSSMSYEVAPNDSSGARTGIIEFGTVGAVPEGGSVPEFIVEQTFVLSQRGTENVRPCVESLSPTYRVVSGGGGIDGYKVNVTAPADCIWEPFSAKPWIHIVKVNSDLSSEETSGRGNGSFNYAIFGSAFGDVPSGHPVGVIAVGGKEHTVYLEDWVSNCLIKLFCKYLPSSCPDGTLSEARDFRDQVLAKTPRGQRYTQLYYKFSTEAAGLVMLNPMLVLRSREMMERYMPIIKSMASGDQVTLTMSDLDDIESFLNSFAQKGTPELRESLKGLCEDLRDPQVHAEFNITITDDPKHESPPRDEVQTVKQTGMMLAPIGLLLFCSYAARRRRNNQRRRRSADQCSKRLARAFLIGAHWRPSPLRIRKGHARR